jgi:DNA (cytosine-5)-methyltransferase 1
MGAADVGAPHQRDRIWICARRRDILSHSKHNGNGRWEQQSEGVEETNREVANSQCKGLERQSYTESLSGNWSNIDCGGGLQVATTKLAHPKNEGNVRGDWQLGVAEEEHDYRRSQANGGGQWWQAEPDVGRVADGVAARMDRLTAIGNGQVPEVARRAWEALNDT